MPGPGRRSLARVLTVACLSVGMLGVWVAPAWAASWPVDVTAAASVAAQDPGSIDLFYGAELGPDAWLARDQAAFARELASGTLSEQDVYNQWLAIWDVRTALYARPAATAYDVLVYASGASAELHALDLALWARERALLAMLGAGPAAVYPSSASLGYRAGGQYLNPGGASSASAPTPAEVAALIRGLPVPPTLLRDERVLLWPGPLPREYGLTDVVGPRVGIWLGANAGVDLRHVLYHELAHGLQFRYGGYDALVPGQSLSAFWQRYLAIRGLTWADPTKVAWAERTPECWAEDFAWLFDGPRDPMGYRAACGAPSAAQAGQLLTMIRDLGPRTNADSPFLQADWVHWLAPVPTADFGDFRAVVFTAGRGVPLGLHLSSQAVGGPFTLELASGRVLGTLHPGETWWGTVDVPAGGSLEVDADTPRLILSSIQVYRQSSFAPLPRISGVFPDTVGDWSRGAVAAAVRLGVVSGYPDGLFRPAQGVSRAEFARMLATAPPGRLFAQPPGSAPEFSDVPPSNWAFPFVGAVGLQLPGTTAGGAFDPSRPLTRQEAMAWLSQVFGWPAVPAGQAAAILSRFPDGTSVDPGLAGLVASAVQQGAVRGDAGTGLLRPRATLTRAEAAVLVLRAVQASGS